MKSRNWKLLKSLAWWKKIVMQYYVGKFYYGLKANKGEYIMRKDWDNLIVLDACRLDLFKELSGCNSDYIISRGSDTSQFLSENIVGNKYDDTVMITANPVVDTLVKDCFYKFISVWKNGWDDDLQTVPPGAVVRATLKARKRYPDKRLIAWFIQPHFPFIEVNSNMEFQKSPIVTGFNKQGTWVKSPWEEAKKGTLDISEVWKAYRKNLKIVLAYAFELANKLTGKTVITADHGEAFERLKFPLPVIIAGHPRYIRTQSLIRVPWLIVENNHKEESGLGKVTKQIQERFPYLVQDSLS